MKREHPPTPFFLSCPSLLTQLGGDVIFFTCQGVVEKTKTPPQTEHPLKRTKQGLESIGRARARYSYPQQFPGRYRGKHDPYRARRGTDTSWHAPTAQPAKPTAAGGQDSSPKPNSKAKPNAHSAESPSPGTPTSCQPAPKPTTSHPSAGEDSTPSTTGKSSAEHATEAKAIAANQTSNSNNKPQKTLFHGDKPANPHRGHPLHTRARPRTA